MIDHGTSIGDQTLQAAGGGVIGHPWFEGGVMRRQQPGQIKRILGVALGAAGDEGFAKLLQRDGIDRIQADELEMLEEDDEIVSRLLQTDGDPMARKGLLESLDPLLKSFRGGADTLMFSAAVPQVEKVKVGCFIGSIQSNDNVEECRIHNVGL